MQRPRNDAIVPPARRAPVPPAPLPRCVAESGALPSAKPPAPPLPVDGASESLRRFLARRVGERRWGPTLRELLERGPVSWQDRLDREVEGKGLRADVPPEAIRPLLDEAGRWPGLDQSERRWLTTALRALLGNAEALEAWEATRRRPGEEPAPQADRERARHRANAAYSTAKAARHRPILTTACGDRTRTRGRSRARRSARRRAAARATGPRSGQDPGGEPAGEPEPADLAGAAP
jgi:hypothetical protein